MKLFVINLFTTIYYPCNLNNFAKKQYRICLQVPPRGDLGGHSLPMSNTNRYTHVKPYNQVESKTTQLSRMFDTISGQYDKFNDLMSLGLARIWRKKALMSLQPYDPKQILDIATGTGDFSIKAFEYVNPDFINGIDISSKMMKIAKMKAEKLGLSNKTNFEVQDVADLKFENQCFDAVTISFGIRNFEKLDEALLQIHRVLKSGGHLLILEMNEPRNKFLLQPYKIYTRIFVRMTTKYLSTDSRAYNYLTDSMHYFASGKELIQILQNHNFKIVKYQNFSFGVCSLYLVERV